MKAIFAQRCCFVRLLKAGQNEFSRLFDRFVSEGAERIEEYSSGLLICLGCFGESSFSVRLTLR